MNKVIFLSRLAECLKRLPKEDRDDALNYYREYFEEMGADEQQDVTVELGQPEEVAKVIIADCTEKRIDTQKEKGGIKSSAMVIWMIVLAVFASPIAIPLAFTAVILLFALLVVLVSVVFSIVCAGGAAVVAGVYAIGYAFVAGGIAEGLICAGAGMIALGIGTIILIASVKFGELCIRLIAMIFKSIFLKKKRG